MFCENVTGWGIIPSPNFFLTHHWYPATCSMKCRRWWTARLHDSTKCCEFVQAQTFSGVVDKSPRYLCFLLAFSSLLRLELQFHLICSFVSNHTFYSFGMTNSTPSKDALFFLQIRWWNCTSDFLTSVMFRVTISAELWSKIWLGQSKMPMMGRNNFNDQLLQVTSSAREYSQRSVRSRRLFLRSSIRSHRLPAEPCEAPQIFADSSVWTLAAELYAERFFLDSYSVTHITFLFHCFRHSFLHIFESAFLL